MTAATLERPAVRLLGLTWSCGHAVHEGSRCKGTDPGAYVKHMRGHGRRSLSPSVQRIKLHRKPPAATLRKLEIDPLSWVEWTEGHTEPIPCECGHGHDDHGPRWVKDDHPVRRYGHRGHTRIDGHWSGDGCEACGCTISRHDLKHEHSEAQRRGQFLSMADLPRYVWIIPDSPAPWETGRAEPVKLHVTSVKQATGDTIMQGTLDATPEPASPAPVAATEPEPETTSTSAQAVTEDDGGEAPMTTTQQEREAREARMAELVRQARAEAPPKVDDATMAAYRENLAAVRAEAGLDAQSVPAGLRAPQTQAVAVAEPERAVATRAAGTLATSANPGDGMHALANLARFHMHYDYWDAPQYADLLAAWELQCAAMEDDGSPIWRALPRLIVAGMYGNGKSGTLDQIAMATGSNVLVECTYPGIRDRIAKDRKVVILDDAQMTFGTTGKASAKVRLIVNTHTKGRVTQDGKNGELSAYGQMAMAGLSSMLTGKIAFTIEDTLSRCLVLHKPRKPKGYHVPEIPDAAEAIVRGKVVPGMREWCMAYRDALRARAAEFGEGAPTGLPDLGGGGRGNDQLARPLLAVCDVATALVPEHMREALPREQWDWSARIRKALIFVAGVPEVVDEDESALESVGAAFDELWMEDER